MLKLPTVSLGMPSVNLSSLKQRLQDAARASLETNKRPMAVEMQDFSRRSIERENDVDLTVNLVNHDDLHDDLNDLHDNREDSESSSRDSRSDTPEKSEKEILISKILELQRTVEDVENKVLRVRQQNLQLEAENLVISDYILNLMRSSETFQEMRDSFFDL
uniref:Short coiled-coil protein n=1 Tax=Acartia pacifica TaxID=335913 RepID=R9TDZ7_ACAPC|nr:short coiled-coil protein [Acartia pacifica]